MLKNDRITIFVVVCILGIFSIVTGIFSLKSHNATRNVAEKPKTIQQVVYKAPKIISQPAEAKTPKKTEQVKVQTLEKVATHPEIMINDDIGATFEKGDSAMGYRLEFSNGNIYEGARVINSAYSGTVYGGYIWPTTETMSNFDYKIIDPSADKPDKIYHKQRIADIKNKTISLNKGETAYGYKLSFSNGKVFYGAGVIDSPYSGTVTYGIIWPGYRYDNIIEPDSNIVRIINPKVDSPWPLRHRELNTSMSPNDKLPFNKGDTVIGRKLTFSNGIIYETSGIANSPYSGFVTDGIIWPPSDYFSEETECSTEFPSNYRLLTRKDLE